MAEQTRNYKELLREIGELRQQLDEMKQEVEKSRAEKKQNLEREHFINDVFSSVQDGISILDLEMNIIAVNPTMEKWYQHNQPLVGKKCYRAYHCRDQPCEICPTIKTMKTSKPDREFVPYRVAKGEIKGWIDLYTFPIFDQKTGRIKAIIEYVRDVTDQKKVEDALRESEEKYRTLVEQANDGIAILQDYRVIFINQRLADMYGDTTDHILGRMFVDFIHPSVMPQLVQYYEQRLKGEAVPNMYETVLQTKNGDPMSVEINARSFLYNGKPADLVIVRDITERRTRDTELKRQQDLFGRITETSPVGITVVDAQGRIIFANPQAEKIFGLNRKEIEKRVYNDSAWQITDFHGQTVSAEDLPYQSVLRTRQPVYDIRHALVHPDGHRIMLSINGAPLFNQQNEIEAVVFTLNDITTRLQIEATLRASEEKFRIIAQSTNDLLWEWDIPNQRLEWLGDVDAVLGYQAGEFPRTIDALIAVIHPEDRERVKTMMERHLNDREPYHVEYRVCRKDHNYCWWIDRGVAVRDRQGRPYRMYGACTDVTEYRKTQEAVQTSLQRLDKTMEGTINALANTVAKRDPYTLSHQLRVTELALAIGQVMGLSQDQLKGLRIMASLHDIGKIYVPAEILSKPARLSEAEIRIVRTHPQAGFEILETIEFDWPVAAVVLQHHERLNGSGYPAGLTDPDILLEAKILAVADVVEAMLSHRPYRASYSLDDALAEIIKNRGVLYNPEIVDICVELFREKHFTFQHQ